MGTLNRFNGAILGVAVGDAIGAQTMGAAHPAEVPLVNQPRLVWTDQTQHLTATLRALVEALALPYDRRVVGRAMATELVRWYHDPTTAERSPGRSSLDAVVRLLEDADWETSGNRESDGADPLPRAIAVGLAWPPDQIVEPVVTITSVTHRHPTALQAAVVLAWLISALARGARLGPALVEEACRVGTTAFPEGKAVRSVGVALDLVRRSNGREIADVDPLAMPAGDGGRRCGSALGLAVLLALAFDGQPDWRRVERAVTVAARLPGGPEVVAAVTGAILGAAWGLGAVPRHLVENTEARDALVALGRALHARAVGLDPALVSGKDEADLTEAWQGGDPPGDFVDGTRPLATDIEWVAEEQGAQGPQDGHADEARDVEWIRVGDEEVAEMEEADADLLVPIPRRW